jgi:hypothetical protein
VPVRIAAPNSVPRSEAKTKRFIRE